MPASTSRIRVLLAACTPAAFRAHPRWPAARCLMPVCLAALALLLAACTPSPQATPTAPTTPDVVVAPTAAPTGTATASRTPPPTPTATGMHTPEPTYTKRPTRTPTATPTLTRTPRPTLTPSTPLYGAGTPLPRNLERITAANADRLALLARREISGALTFFSPDGTLLATWDFDTETVHLYRVSDGSLAFVVEGLRPVFSPDSALLATIRRNQASGSSVRVYRVSDGQLLRDLPGLISETAFLTFSPDSRRIAGGGGCPMEEELRIHGGDRVMSMAHRVRENPLPQPECSFTRMWRVSDGSLLLGVSSGGVSLTFSPDSTLLAVGDSLYRADDGSLLFSLGSCCAGWTGVKAFNPGGGSVSSEFSPDGTLLETQMCGDPVCSPVQLYRVSDGALVFESPGDMEREGFAGFSPGGTLLATVFDEEPYHARLYRVSDGRLMLEVESRLPPGPVFSPDGTLLATVSGYGPDYTTRLYRTSDGSLMREVEGWYWFFSPDGTLLAIATDAGIELWGIAP